MAVYFIQVGAGGPVKIGYADDVAGRMAALQCANPEPLALLRIVDGDRRQEAAAHRMFSEHRLRGEWFAFAPDMLTAEIIQPPSKFRPPLPSPRDHIQLIGLLGGSGELSRRLKLRQSAVGNWLLRGIPWKYRTAVSEIAKSEGIELPFNFLGLEREAA